MQSTDVVLWARDYSAREYTPGEFDQYERQNPGERPVQALGRYIGYPWNEKCISHYPGAYRAHWDSGRPVFLFHQIGYSDMGTGYDGGRAHAQTALTDARSSAVGWDGESPIVACFDRFYAKKDYATLTRDQLREYMRGYRSVLGYDLSGFYGFFDSMAHAIAEGWANFTVQCGARSAHVPGIKGWQENNYQPPVLDSQTDIIEIYQSPFGDGFDMDKATFTEWFRDSMATWVKLDAVNAAVPDQRDALRELVWGAEVNVIDSRQLVPSKEDPKKLVPAQWLDRVDQVLTSTNRHAAWGEKNTDDLIKRAVEEIDEAELAKELTKLGFKGGATAAEFKAMLADLLSRVTLSVQVPGAPQSLTAAPE